MTIKWCGQCATNTQAHSHALPFWSTDKPNATYISSSLGWFCTHPHELPTVYQVFDTPGHVCQTVTSPGFWRHTSVSEGALRKHLWSECCEPTALIYEALSCTPSLPQKLKYSVHVGGSTPLAHAQFHKIIDTSTCFIWFVVSFLSDASLTMVNNWLDCFLCLSLTHFLAIWGSRILVHLLYFHDQKIKPAMYI